MISTHFSLHFSLALFLDVFTQFSFIFQCECKLGLKHLHTAFISAK